MTGPAPAPDVVQEVFNEHAAIVAHLQDAGELSYSTTLESTFPKIMLLSAASNLEEQVKTAVLDFVRRRAGDSEELVSFLRNKAIERQYHTFFNWDGRNANSFFGLFGESFKQRMKEHVDADPDLTQAIRDFLDLGNARNTLVHGDYAAAAMDKSARDVLTQYHSACVFVRWLETRFGSSDA
ncbi:HEPN domain-containing protein [Mycobacterium sp. NPDC006124]|uniref:HEPN domain-containing protein n=1 Tax=Mycobacterium sp. NPDC006124 TaxID=3156729 RepID=UPI0033A20234